MSDETPQVGRRATLTDVARAAGVSRQTASRVARGGENVNARTAARVRRAIKALGYRPDPIARALSTGRGRIVGLLTHQLTHQRTGLGAVSIMIGVEQAATELGLGVSIATFASFDRGTVQDAVDRLARAGCDGVIFMAPWVSAAKTLRAVEATLPMVATSEVPEYDGLAVHADAAKAAGDVVDHLVSLGHTTVHHVGGPPDWTSSRLRLLGWENALRRTGAEVPEPLIGDWTARSGYEAGLRLADDPSVTAIFAANDEMALGVIYALIERGRHVPEDVSVAGYDDAPGSDYLRPPLTTIKVDDAEHGRQAVAQLILRLNGEPPLPSAVVPHELIIRASTAPHE
ncbi:DNA-binding LacI/PurR family transcriptional regulator [Kribbella antiqua]|uniref:DNA-binding LacI/PurR family transcriptional regulator n=1 Tax=Kribbella antiqua TaxID=2512217 RepID=A0A4R2IZJ9_9ACTN|nr:substrate-binding domain-containing protein [Kribbella antiqua]TCO51381.1 DNA-binding LacI/PurR family transcriptional regulator [Kribbella antiqua]